MDPTKLREQYAALITEAKRLGEPFKGKEAEMSQETMDQIAATLGKADEVKARLDLANRMAGAEAFMGEPAHAPVTMSSWRPTGPDEGNAPVDVKAWRAVTLPTIFGEREFRFHVPLAVQAKGYAPAFEGYLRKGYADLGPSDRKALSEGTDTSGGFLVPEDYQTELIKKIATNAMIRSLARVVQTGRDMAGWPRINYSTDDKYTSGVRLTWTGESPASATAHRVTEPVFGKINIPVHTAMASMPLTNDFLEDAVFDVLGYSQDLFAEAFALDEDNVFLNGTGANQPMGILTQVDGDGPASKVSGTSAAITTSGDAHSGKRVNDVYYALPAQYRRRGVWVANSGTVQALDDLVDGNKRPILQTLNNGSMMADEPQVLKGKRVIVDEFMPDIAANSYPLLFGDLSGYVVLDRVGLAIQRLTELYAETNMTLLLARKRVGGYCAESYRFKVLKASA